MTAGRKGYDREQVVAAAMNAFWEKGFHGTSLMDLRHATGLNPKSLYAEFGDKSQLFCESVALYSQAGLAQSRAALSAEPRGLENVRRYFRGMRYQHPCRGCLMTMTINERKLAPAAALEEIARALSEIEALLRRNLSAGGFSRAQSSRLATFLIFSIQGITTMGKLEGDNRRLAHTVASILSVLE